MNKLTTAETLHLGIKAVKEGLNGVARAHLMAVLEQDSHNIPAMLWLAYVSPKPEDSLRLLNRILVLDPNNEQAKSGIRWAKVRLKPLQNGPDLVEPQHQPKPTQTAPATIAAPPHKTRPARRASKKVKGRPPATRLQYAMRPLLIIVVVGLLGAIIGVGVSMFFMPSKTLAAWLPTPAELPRWEANTNVPPTPSVQFVKVSQVVAPRDFASASDTIHLKSFQSIESDNVEQSSPTQLASETIDSPTQLLDEEVNLLLNQDSPVSSTEPSVLIGPAQPVNSKPVDPAQLAHQPAYPGEKWIEVNVTTQEVTAWEGNVPVMSFIVSTGLPNTPTVLGEYNIYWKLERTLMTGDDYYLPDVPYTMYFFKGYGLHGTYWHDNFGQPMSHGCVNLTIDNSKRLFEWADPVIPPGQTDVWADADNPGTLVVVHE